MTRSVAAVLTVEEKAGILHTQSVRGHTGVVPIILFSHVGNHENSSHAMNLDINALGVGQPGDERRRETHEMRQYLEK